MLKRRIVTHGCHLWETDPERQVGEVLRRFDLFGAITPFSRCPRCNGMLAAVDKAAIAARLPPYTRASYHEFHRCQYCGRLYWKGAHYQRLQQLVQRLSAR